MKVAIGKGLELDIDLNRLGLPDEATISEVARHIIYLGLRNALMDSHAGVEVEKSREMAEKKLEAMYRGEVRVASSREADPVKAEAMRLATKAVETAIRKAGKKTKDYERKAISDMARANVDKFMATAAKNLKAAKVVEVDLAGL